MRKAAMKKDQHKFKIVFEGDVEKVDVNILIATLLNTTTILNEINHELESKHKLEIRIEPFAPGSFEIIYALAPHTLVGDLISHLVSSETVGYLADLVAILAGILGLKQLLKGKKPESIEDSGDETKIMSRDEIKITSRDGNVIIIDKRAYNIYGKNPIVNDAINKTFRTIDENEQIDQFKILSESGEKLFKADRPQFKEMHEKNELIEEDLEIVNISEAKLYLHKIVFQKDNKWGFIYEGNKIGAFIKDDEFFEKLDDHTFNLGDYFVAEMRIIRRYDPEIKAYLNQEYEILKIKNHVKMPVQQKLDFKK